MTTPAAELVALADLARRQGGVFTRAQTVRAGYTAGAVTHRVRTGRWVRLHGSVLAAATSDVGPRGRRWAALLHVGPAAVLSHRTAAELWGLGIADRGLVHLTTTGGRTPYVPGAQVGRTTLSPSDVDAVDGLPVTTRLRTLVDCLATVPRREAETLLARADRERWCSAAELGLAIDDRAQRRGMTRLRELVAARRLRPGTHAAHHLVQRLGSSDVVGWVGEHPVITAVGVQLVPVALPELRLALVLDDAGCGTAPRSAVADRELVLAGWTVLHLTSAEAIGPPGPLRDLLGRALAAAARNPLVVAP